MLCHRSDWRRSIPACAGEPLPGGQARRPPGVYPRVCGGTHDIATPMAGLNGLSPRVRGNPVSNP